MLPLPARLEALAAQVRAGPIFHKAFTLPVEFGLVELDRLVVAARANKSRSGRKTETAAWPEPSLEQIFGVCLRLDHPTIEHGVRIDSPDTVVFASDSNDPRFLESVLLKQGQIPGIQSNGPILGIVGILVGYSSNYLNVISAEGRLVLHNGTHRAYALCDLGLTHAPCIVQKASSRQELSTVAVGAFLKNPDYYFEGAAPAGLQRFLQPASVRAIASSAD